MPYAANPPPSPLERSCIIAMDFIISSPFCFEPSKEIIPEIAQPDGILTSPSRFSILTPPCCCHIRIKFAEHIYNVWSVYPCRYFCLPNLSHSHKLHFVLPCIIYPYYFDVNRFLQYFDIKNSFYYEKGGNL